VIRSDSFNLIADLLRDLGASGRHFGSC